MSDQRRHEEASRRISDEAASWVVRQARGLTDEEQDALSDWLAASPVHRRCFAAEHHTWRTLDRLASWRPQHALRPNRDLLAPPPRARWRMLPIGLALAAAALVIAAVWWARPPSYGEAAPVRFERRLLADGSVVDLNSGAALRVEYSTGARTVHLERGEAHFTVVPDASRPFVVSAQGIAVRAVGTAFGVRLETAGVQVLVTEGNVRVDPAGTTAADRQPAAIAALGAGELAVIPLDAAIAPQIRRVSDAEVDRLLAWQPRLLEFKGAPLREVVAEFNRRNEVQLVVADPALDSLALTLSFRSDNVEGFVRLLEGAFAIESERSGRAILLQRAR